MDAKYSTPPEINRLQRTGLIAGIIFLIIFLAVALINGGAPQFFHSYLLGFIFWNGIGVGCLGLLMLQYVIRGSWGLLIRRVLEAGSRTLWLTAILALPILFFGYRFIYPWVHPDSHNEELVKAVELKQPYLSPWFFALRGVIYFAIWLGLMFILNRLSAEQDRTADRRLTKQQTNISAPGLVLFVLTITFASVDWVMSLDPEWFSTIFGLIFVIGWILSAFTLAIAVMVQLQHRPPLEGLAGKPLFHDLGKLLLAFVMVWAYFSFSQFVIIWSGNLPEEGHWYWERLRGGWQYMALALPVLHFALPFVLLLSRDLKKNARRLMYVALLVFLMRFVDLYWYVIPAFHHATELAGEHAHEGSPVLDAVSNIAAWLGIGGIWLAFFAYQLKQRPLIPLNDPHMPDVLEYAHGGHH